MNRLLVGRVLSLGLLVVLVVLALSACGGDEKKAKARPLPEELQKPLRPGTYRSEEFKPSLSFRVGKGWETYTMEVPDILRISRGETAGGFGFANIHEVYKPTRTGTLSVGEAPEDIVGWFRRHPYLDTTEPEPTTVGGIEGVQFDVVVEDLPRGHRGLCLTISGADCVDIARFGDEQILFLPKGARGHLIVLKGVEGETVTMFFGSPKAEFDEFAPEAQKVVDSVKWRGS